MSFSSSSLSITDDMADDCGFLHGLFELTLLLVILDRGEISSTKICKHEHLSSSVKRTNVHMLACGEVHFTSLFVAEKMHLPPASM